MGSFVFRAPPMRWADIENRARSLRRSLGLEYIPYFPVVEILEKVLHENLSVVEMRITEDKIMNGAEGYTDPAGRYIEISESVYEAACAGGQRSRWTIAHEIGHWVLHTKVPLARVSSNLKNQVRVFENPETQAHQFAAGLLIPAYLITEGMSAIEIMRSFGVSQIAAEKRISYLMRQKEKWGGV